MLDAYTVRKAIPRIMLAVIGINLSIYLCVAAVDITNIIGHGIGDLITNPFLENKAYGRVDLPTNATNITAGVFGLLTLLGVGAAGIWAGGLTVGIAVLSVLVPFLISMALITFAILFTLIIRQALLVFLVVISPVAIALFVLPGTEKYFKKWLDLFIKTLMVYPIIAILFAMSTVMAQILLGSAELSAGAIGLVKILGSVIVVFAPLVMIPFAFKLAGGAIAAVMNAAGSRSAGISQRAGKGIQAWKQNPNSWAGKQSARARDQRIEKGATGGQILSGFTGGMRGLRKGQGFGKGYKLASGALATEKSALRLGELGKMEAMQPIMNNDDFLVAGKSFRDEKGVLRTRTDQEMKEYMMNEQGYSEHAAEQGVASIKRGLATSSQQEFDRFAAVQLAGTGTGYKVGGVAEMNQAIIDASAGDKVLQGSMVAAARSKAGEARRFDLLPGFGTHMGTIQEQEDFGSGKYSQQYIDNIDVSTEKGHEEYEQRTEVSRKITRAGGINNYVNERLTDQALFTQGPGAIVGGRGDSVRNLVPAIKRRSEQAELELKLAKTVDQKAAAERRMIQDIASNAALLDVSSQVSPENARIIADGVLAGHQIDLGNFSPGLFKNPATGEAMSSGKVSMQDAIELLRSNSDFQSMRREYQSSTMGQYQQAQAQAANSAIQGTTTQPPPPNIR